MFEAYLGLTVLGLVGVGWGLWMLIWPEGYLRFISFRGHIKGAPWRNSIPIRPISITVTRYLGGITIPASIGGVIYFMILISQ
jgi:hypothetical protein